MAKSKDVKYVTNDQEIKIRLFEMQKGRFERAIKELESNSLLCPFISENPYDKGVPCIKNECMAFEDGYIDAKYMLVLRPHCKLIDTGLR